MDDKVYSDFEIKETAIKFKNDEKGERIGCIGTLDETLNTRSITKKCEGIVRKYVVKGDGTANVKFSLHMRWNHFVKALGMKFDTYKDGVYAYGENSTHEEACITGKVYDEDGRAKLKAYPRFMITDGVARKIENGAEEVAEIEISGIALPDDDGNCTYEVMMEELNESDKETFTESFMTNFNVDLLKVTTV